MARGAVTAVDANRLFAGGEIEPPRHHDPDLLEAFHLFSDVEVVRGAEGLIPSFGLGRLPDGNQPVGFRVGKGPQDDPFQDGVDGHVPTDGYGDGQDQEGREDRISNQLPEGVLHVPNHGVHCDFSLLLLNSFPRGRGHLVFDPSLISEPATHDVPSLILAEARFHQCVHPAFDVEGDLVLDVGVHLLFAEEQPPDGPPVSGLGHPHPLHPFLG